MCTVGFCDQASSWSSSCGLTEELCNQQPSLVGDWSRILGSTQLVCHVLGSCALKGEIVITEETINSPIGYWGKGSTVGWYKVFEFLYL